MWMSNTATAAMMFSIILPVIFKIPRTSHFSRALVLSIPFACNLGGLGTPIGTPPNAIAITYLQKKGIELSDGAIAIKEPLYARYYVIDGEKRYEASTFTRLTIKRGDLKDVTVDIIAGKGYYC